MAFKSTISSMRDQKDVLQEGLMRIRIVRWEFVNAIFIPCTLPRLL